LAIPDFLIIGAMKAGTASLYSVLTDHPEINLSLVREPSFFTLEDENNTGNWDLGMHWYRNLFRSAPGFMGEASTAYTKFPRILGVPGRIHQTNPDVRLIYLVRNPIDRAISHYLHKVLSGHESKPIQAALATSGNQYLVTSMYYMQIQQYREWFSKEQILVVVCEELWRKPRKSLDQICTFLKIDPAALSPSQMIKRNVTVDKALRRLSQEPANQAQEQLKEALVSGSIARDASARSIGGVLGFDLSSRKRLVSKFVDDYTGLCKYLGHSIVEWDEEFGVNCANDKAPFVLPSRQPLETTSSLPHEINTR
jgi:hypothetical protein